MKTSLGIAVSMALAWVAIAFGSGASAWSQEKKATWEILVSYDGQPETAKTAGIALRPNVTQPVYLFLKNNDQILGRDIHVKIVGPAQAKPWELDGFVEKVGSNKLELVKFKAAAIPGDSIPFELKVTVEEGKGNKKEKIALPVTILRPSDYVEAVQLGGATPQFNDAKKRLTVPLQINADSAAPPCPVELELNKLLIPGLVPPKGSLADVLSAKNLSAELSCENLQRTGENANAPARVAVTVDDYARAFQFHLQPGKLQKLQELTRIRMLVPRYFNPNEKKVDSPKGEEKKADGPKGEKKNLPVFAVLLQGDGLLDRTMRLELAFDREGNGRFAERQVFTGLREQTLALAALAAGNLQFKTLVRDWKMDLNTGRLAGRRTLRLRVLDAGDNPVAIADEQHDERMTLFSKEYQGKYAKLSYDEAAKAVMADIVIDGTGPEEVKFVDLPARAAQGSTLVLKARVKERTKDEAPIDKVLFFAGDPKKAPAIRGKLDPSGSLWTADVKIPADAKDKQLPVAVQVSTANDMTASAEGLIAMSAASDEPSKITGIVKADNRVYGGRQVVLKDAKGRELKRAETNDAGAFTFDEVAPGKYQVWCSVSGLFRGAAAATVTKEKGETIKADIKMIRTP